MVRDVRVKEYIFPVSDLVASAAGLFDVYSDHAINGTIQSINIGSNSYTSTGSHLLFESGTINDGVQAGMQFMRIATSLQNQVVYPAQISRLQNNSVVNSGTNFIDVQKMVCMGPLRLVGSGMGNGTSGTYFAVRYI